jgi:putative DNA primase/helicase
MIRETETMLASDDEALVKWARASRSRARIESAIAMLPKIGLTVTDEAFNPKRHMVNVDNGVLNLETLDLVPHNPELMINRTIRDAYHPHAPRPRFDQFMEQIQPNPEVRDYIQRALGYTLRGDSDQRALFVAYGPSGTGKSTLMEIMRLVFGDYGAVAPSGTFKQSREKAPSNDLHRLMGRRFVTSSETAESASFDEDLLKRITGRDQLTSRGLYEEFAEWTPELVLWLATNHPPRFSSDDEALWRRVKMIPFTQQLTGEGEIFDFARKVLLPEADGIFAWLVEGLRMYQERGLDEPSCIRSGVREQQLQADNVARFLEDSTADGLLAEEETGVTRTRDLYIMYSDWCRMSGEKPYGSRRFIQHVEQTGKAVYQRDKGQSVWLGLRKVGTLTMTWGLQNGQ